MQFNHDTITETYTTSHEIDVTSATLGQYKAIIRHTPENDVCHPRHDCDNLGTITAEHRDYNLADEHAMSVEELDEALQAEPDEYISLPVYLYDHSGLSMSTTPFSCPWDSGQVGIIYVTRAEVAEQYRGHDLPSDEQIKEYLADEINTYSQWLEGEVYSFQILDKDGEEVDACSGYIGLEAVEQEASSTLEYFAKKAGVA
jgi:DNA-directed RNA polymerase specialized sigma subunit